MHLVLWVAVLFALYPVMWVTTQALSGGGATEGRIIPWPATPSLDHFTAVIGRVTDEGVWLFGLQLLNSVVVSAATALTAIGIATPAAYALSRFRFVGAEGATRTLLATQMFPGVAASIPLYLLLDGAGLLDTRTGLVLVYATSAVPFAIFQLRGAFDAIPRELEEAAMVDGATRFVAFVRVVLPAVADSPGLHTSVHDEPAVMLVQPAGHASTASTAKRASRAAWSSGWSAVSFAAAM